MSIDRGILTMRLVNRRELETQREAKTKMLITFMGALLLGMNAIEISVGTSRGRDR